MSMRKSIQLLCATLIVCSGCIKATTVEYKLTAEQLAWQPYKAGDALRFGQARSSKVRTFAVTEVNEHFEQYSVGGNAPVYLGPAQKVKEQTLNVLIQRTDTIRYVRTPTSTPTRPDSIVFTYPTEVLNMRAGEGNDVTYINWDIGFGNTLPLRQLAGGLPFADTTQHLLPTLRLGGIEYGPVLRISNALSSTPTYGYPLVRPASLVYFAKGHGVVGFVVGSTLWYRLP